MRISKNGKYVPEDQANKYYDAISVGIDFTARDIQANLKKKGLPWEKAKAWDNSAVKGDWVMLTEEMLTAPILFSLTKNAEQVQMGDTKDMIFSFDHIVSHISQYFSLNIGDMIYTGTPAGVGECVVGDQLEGYLETKKLFELEIK